VDSVVLPHQTLWEYSDGNPPNGGVGCRWGRQKFSTNIWLHRVLSLVWLPSVLHTAVLDCGKLVTLITGKQCHLLFAGDGRQSVYDKKLRRRQQNRTEFSCTQW